MNGPVVLVLSHDALAAALVGAAAELAGSPVEFPRAAEAARDALRRTRPGVVLVDGEHAEACTESFVGPALMTGARVVLFHGPTARVDVVPFATRHALPVVRMPVDVEGLRAVLNAPAPRPL